VGSPPFKRGGGPAGCFLIKKSTTWVKRTEIVEFPGVRSDMALAILLWSFRSVFLFSRPLLYLSCGGLLGSSGIEVE